VARAEDHSESIEDAAGHFLGGGAIGGHMKKTLIFSIAAAFAIGGGFLSGQTVPTIQFDSNPNPLTMPDNIHLGEVAGVATNSRGDIYVYTRTGNPTITIGTARAVSHGGGRLFQFDRTGKYVREIGQGIYGFLQPQQVRVDPQDTVWVVDQMSTQVIKFDSNGRVQMVLSRKPEAMTVPAPRLTPLPTNIPTLQPEPPAGGGGGRGGGAPQALPGAGVEGESFSRPTDVAWDAQGNIYVADGYGNARVAKYDRNGKWLKNWGSRGTGQGQFNIVHGIAIDAQGNVYVGDEGNKRVQVFDTEGTFKTQFTNVGAPTALCLTRGAQPVLYVAHTGDPDGMDDAAIYKVDLKGNVLGRFGSAGKLPKEFSLVNSIDCRNENELLVGELANWRVQKITLRAAK
jgi:DNA-binding beta-propeller fold protein YncE